MQYLSILLGFAVVIASLPAQRLIGVDSSREVSSIDMTTGARTVLGSITANAGITAAAAYDEATGRLFVTSSNNTSLYVVDVTNWSATWIGNFGLGSFAVMHGLEWDSSTGTLYAISSYDGCLYTIDTTTAAATLVGPTGFTIDFQNLTYDSLHNVLYMANSTTDSLYSVNRSTGGVTLIGPLTGVQRTSAMAFDRGSGLLYLADNLTDTLYTVDPLTAAATAIGALGVSNVLGLAYIAGTGSLTRAVHGCGVTTIASTGHPSIGSTIQTTVGATTGLPLVGFGLTSVGVPFCGCTIGHEWSVAAAAVTVPLVIPAAPTLVGAQVYIQGMDFLGATGCPAPQLTLTDTITLTIG
jgi:hypothetical protein